MKKTVKRVARQKQLTFLPLKKVCTFTGRPSILEVALQNEIPLNHSCGGMGSCTTCRVFIIKGCENLDPRNEVESEHAQMRDFLTHERLSCQTEAQDGLICEIPPENSEVENEGK